MGKITLTIRYRDFSVKQFPLLNSGNPVNGTVEWQVILVLIVGNAAIVRPASNLLPADL